MRSFFGKDFHAVSGVFGHWRRAAIYLVLLGFACSPGWAFTLPENFDNTEVISNLADPDGLAFSPDGRMFISERITGKLRVATYNAGSDSWSLLATPFHTFDTPKDDNGNPQARRSGGLRDIAFDPNFVSNGLIYAFYMKNGDLQNRVVRIKESTTSPNTSDPEFPGAGLNGEQLLIDLPFNDSEASGSHNGGAIEFGGDNLLYITTGDGWEGPFQGDPVQSLSTFTGKVLRINADGSIPTNNPFYGSAAGNYRAIYALGLRNPYSMSVNPDNGKLYINEARGADKADIYIVEAGHNYRHEGANSGIGTDQSPWANAATAGGELITGGAWMPENPIGNFPESYNGVYFTALWGGNSSPTGRINYIQSASNTAVTAFETDVGINGSNGNVIKPVTTRIGPEGDLYYLLTTYQTSSGSVRRVRYTSQQTVVTPVFSVPGGISADPVNVGLSTTTPGASIYYTTDNQTPTTASSLYSGTPVVISQDTILKARAFLTGFNPSGTASAAYFIGERPDNVPPVVSAGVDRTVFTGQTTVLDGSATTDPDGDDDFLTGEQWLQLGGPEMLTIADATEEIASFTPVVAGTYTFSLEVSDGFDSGTDTVAITAVKAPRVTREITALYTFEDGAGSTVDDVSGVSPALNLSIDNTSNTSWITEGGIRFTGSAMISALDNKIQNTCEASNALSVEAWAKPANTTQGGPSRIATFSTTTTVRNFMLGQIADSYDMRLRTTTTDNNGVPSISAPASTAETELTHIIYTRETDGGATLYVNGVPQVVGSVGGNFSNWADNQHLIIGNELSGDRPWLGDIHLVAVYCAGLTETEVRQNFSAGLPPYESLEDSDDDNVADVIDNCPDDSNPLQENTDGDMLGDACDPDSDNDGVENLSDSSPLDPQICQDLDNDMCNDCSVGSDGFGPLIDFNIAADGLDTDGDGICNIGDTDDDNDNVPDDEDTCPLDADSDNDPAVCGADSLCIPVQTRNGAIAMVCL